MMRGSFVALALLLAACQPVTHATPAGKLSPADVVGYFDSRREADGQADAPGDLKQDHSLIIHWPEGLYEEEFYRDGALVQVEAGQWAVSGPQLVKTNTMTFYPNGRIDRYRLPFEQAVDVYDITKGSPCNFAESTSNHHRYRDCPITDAATIAAMNERAKARTKQLRDYCAPPKAATSL